jgi:general secretion pathway protein G
MRNNRQSGFTLVEILIVVVILGILAAIVVPQFTNASNEAIKGALQTQLQTINSQVELFRVRNQGAYPDFEGGANDGWESLLNNEYLKEVPLNGYTGESALTAGTAADARAEERTSTSGWMFDVAQNYTVYACGLGVAVDGRAFLQHEIADGDADDVTAWAGDDEAPVAP